MINNMTLKRGIVELADYDKNWEEYGERDYK